MKEYRVEEITNSRTGTETTLNEMAEEGWKVVGINEYWIFFEREAVAKERQQING
jgi:hypothetical protein